MAYSIVAFRGGYIVEPQPLIEDGGEAQNENFIELLSRTGPYYRGPGDPTPNDDSANTSGNGVFFDLSSWINIDVNPHRFWQCVDATPTAAVWVELASGGAPGGPDRSVQFNDAGAFGGDANLTWDGGLGINGFVGIQTAPEADYLIKGQQQTPNQGLYIRSENLSDFLKLHTGSGGQCQLYSTAYMSLQSGGASVYVLPVSTSHVFLHQAGAAGNIYARGDIVSQQDSPTGIVLGAGLDASIGFDGTALALDSPSTLITNRTVLGSGLVDPNATLTIRQIADSNGIRILGHGAAVNDDLRIRLDSVGDSSFIASKNITVSSTTGRIVMGSAAGNLFQLVCGSDFFFDAPGVMNWRDTNAGNATRMQLNYAATPSVGRLVIPEDARNSIVLGVGNDGTIGLDTRLTFSAVSGHSFLCGTGAGELRISPSGANSVLLQSAGGLLRLRSVGSNPVYVGNDADANVFEVATGRTTTLGDSYADDFFYNTPKEVTVPLSPVVGPGGQTEASSIEYLAGVVGYLHRKNFDEGKWFTALVNGIEIDATQGLIVSLSWVYDGATTDTVEWGVEGAAWAAGETIPISTTIYSGAVTTQNGVVAVAEIVVPLTGLGDDEAVQISFKVFRNRSGLNDTLNDDVISLGYFASVYAKGPD